MLILLQFLLQSACGKSCFVSAAPEFWGDPPTHTAMEAIWMSTHVPSVIAEPELALLKRSGRICDPTDRTFQKHGWLNELNELNAAQACCVSFSKN